MEWISPGSFCPATIKDALDHWLALAQHPDPMPGTYPKDTVTVTTSSEQRTFFTASESVWVSAVESIRTGAVRSEQDRDSTQSLFDFNEESSSMSHL